MSAWYLNSIGILFIFLQKYTQSFCAMRNGTYLSIIQQDIEDRRIVVINVIISTIIPLWMPICVSTIILISRKNSAWVPKYAMEYLPIRVIIGILFINFDNNNDAVTPIMQGKYAWNNLVFISFL